MERQDDQSVSARDFIESVLIQDGVMGANETICGGSIVQVLPTGEDRHIESMQVDAMPGSHSRIRNPSSGSTTSSGRSTDSEAPLTIADPMFAAFEPVETGHQSSPALSQHDSTNGPSDQSPDAATGDSDASATTEDLNQEDGSSSHVSSQSDSLRPASTTRTSLPVNCTRVLSDQAPQSSSNMTPVMVTRRKYTSKTPAVYDYKKRTIEVEKRLSHDVTYKALRDGKRRIQYRRVEMYRPIENEVSDHNTIRVIRPCYCTLSNLSHQQANDKWVDYESFAVYYIDQLAHSDLEGIIHTPVRRKLPVNDGNTIKQLYGDKEHLCFKDRSPGTTQSKRKKESHEIIRILGHSERNGEIDYFLVQWKYCGLLGDDESDEVDDDEAFNLRDFGEISWTPSSFLVTDCPNMVTAYRNRKKIIYRTKAGFLGRKTSSNKNRRMSRCLLTNPGSAAGETLRYLRTELEKIPFDKTANCIMGFQPMISFYMKFAIKSNEINNGRIHVFPNLVGRPFRIKEMVALNAELSKRNKAILAPTTVGPRFRKLLGSGNKALVISIIVANNKPNSNFGQHTYVLIMRRKANSEITEYFVHDTMEIEHPYRELPMVVKEVIASQRKCTIHSLPDVRRSFGNQDKSSDCFTRALTYVSQLNDGKPLNESTFMHDKLMR